MSAADLSGSPEPLSMTPNEQIPELPGRAARALRRALLPCVFAVVAALGAPGCGDSSGGFSLGPEAQIDISPLSIDFGDVPRGEIARRNVTVRHVGSSGVIVLDPITLVTDSPDFEIGLIEATTLNPGEQTRIQVIYNSGHDEPDQGELVIGHNLANNPETRISLSSAGQRARLVASPAVMDFGIVQAGAPRTLDLTVLNGGSANATLTGGTFDGDRDGDFHLEIPPEAVVEPGGKVVLKVTYAPTHRDRDRATLHITTERDDVSLDVLVGGEEETPVLTVEPSLVQLGWTRPFEVSQRQVTLRNDGNTFLDVSSVALTDQPASLKLTGVPQSAFRLQPGDAVVAGLIFAPTEEHPMTSEPLAKIRIVSSDEARNPLLVPVYGAAGEPSILVIPEDVVDFAYVAEGFTATREVTVLNVGDSAVTITDAALVDPTSDEFVVVNGGDLPTTLNPGEAFDLAMTFENRSGAQGTEYAKLFLHTSDPVVPEYPLDVIARRAQRPTCEASFVPDLLAFGAYRPGATGRSVIKVVNFGSGNCIYRDYELSGCLAVTEGIRTRFDCNEQIAFNPFRLVSEPTPSDVLGPGGVLEIPIEFVAPDHVTSLYGRDSYYGRLALTMSDPNSGRFQFVAPPGGWGAGVNLRAESAVPLVTVEPTTLEFGLVRTDCSSAVQQVRVAATGPIAATITGLEATGCGDDVRIEAPALPASVPGFGSVFVNVRFTPESIGRTDCTLRITNDSQNLPVVDVALGGDGTDVTHKTDSFLQIPPPKVDVLFIVDDSFSMGDDQQRLKQELPKLVDIAVSWGQDYHLAVTTTDTKLVKGQFKGLPPYVTPETPDPATTFAEHLVVGTAGFYIEKGLEGAYQALFNRSTRTGIACLNLPNQCPNNDGQGLPLLCLDGFCSGKNYGFLRDDAEFVIIIVSDEEDGSERPVSFYVNAFANLKRADAGVGVKVHAIIVTEDGCLGGFGTPGYRYAQAVAAFGGHVADICGDSFGTEFAAVGQRTFGLTDRFYPSLPPAPGSLTVKVNGARCDDWEWSEPTKAVVFPEGSRCFPAFNDTVDLDYDVYCAAPAD